jgi:NTE family protein
VARPHSASSREVDPAVRVGGTSDAAGPGGVPPDDTGLLLSGFTEEVRAELRATLEERTFAAGTVVLGEGERPGELYVIRSGVAEVTGIGPDGVERRLANVGAGATLGEMSFLTNQPATGTVRALTELRVAVIPQGQIEALAERAPRLYRNVGVIVADRLARMNRRAAGASQPRLTLLLDAGAPPLLPYALAASVAWHTRAPTLLLILGDGQPPGLADLTQSAAPHGDGHGTPPSRAHILVRSPRGAYAPESLAGTVEELFRTYAFVLILAAEGTEVSLPGHRTVRLNNGSGRHVSAGADLVVRAWSSVGAARADNRLIDVPEPSPEEERFLADGVLPARGAAGRVLGLLAREIAGLRVGIVLGAGSMRGYAHIGVLRQLEHRGVPVDYLAGTSIGAAVGAFRAAGYPPEQIREIMDRESRNLFRLTIPWKSLCSSLRHITDALGDGRRIEDFPVPLALVAADLITQRQIVFRRGLVSVAVRASTAIPGLYPAERVGPYILVDGGLVNPVPTDVASAMGADKVVAVRLGSGASPVDSHLEAMSGKGAPPSVLHVVARSIEIMQAKLGAMTAAGTILIAPEFGQVPGSNISRLRRFRDGGRYVEIGEAAAEAALPRLAAALPWLRP